MVFEGWLNPQAPQHGLPLHFIRTLSPVYSLGLPPHSRWPETEPPLSPLYCPNIGLQSLQFGHLIKGLLIGERACRFHWLGANHGALCPPHRTGSPAEPGAQWLGRIFPRDL